MLNRNKRDNNKSKGPWGMHEYDFTYSVEGDPLERNRFIQAPDQDTAVEQFEYLMKKEGIDVEILDIQCPY